MDERMQKLLQNAYTIDENDAINKVMTTYHEDIAFEVYFDKTVKFLEKLRFGANWKYVPSSEQLRFIMSRSKYIAVVAAAGSGKTATLTVRMGHDKAIFNVPGKYVLPITFTNNSAADMSKQYARVCRMFGLEDDVEFKTIHKFGADFVSLLSPNTRIITDTNPIVDYVRDESEEDGDLVEVEYKMEDLINQALNLSGVDKKLVTAKMFYSAVNVIAEKMITSDQDFRESSEDYLDFPLKYDQIMEIRKVYQQIKVNHRCIDFTDMLETIHGILVGIPSLDRVQQKKIVEYLTYKRIYVDEVQDVSPLQISIIKQLVRLNPDCKLCVVGDDDQSIYGFRGADPSFLLNFGDIFKPEMPDFSSIPGFAGFDENGQPIIEEYEPCIIGYDEYDEPIYEQVPDIEIPEVPRDEVEIMYMTRNRRSARKIIQAANLVIKNNKFRYDKEMKPMKDMDGSISLVEDVHGIMSSGMILKTLLEEKSKGSGLLGHIGILYREHKQIVPVLNMLVKNRIPFNSVYNENSSLYAFNTFITKDIIGILDMVSDLQNPLLLERYLFKLCPHINKTGAKTISDILKEEQKKPVKQRAKLSAILKSNPMWAKDLDKILNIYTLVKEDAPMSEVVNIVYRDYMSAYLADLLQSKPALQEVASMSLEYLTSEGNIPWIMFHGRHTATIKWVRENHKVSNGVNLASFHAAKGLEYQKVFILEVSDRYSPKAILMTKYSEAGGLKYTEEERRLFYVALTRAKEELTVFYSSDYPDSIFVRELRDALSIIESGDVNERNS